MSGAPMRSPEFARRAGITFRQMDYWARNGYLRPEAAESCSADARVLDDGQLAEIRSLSTAGLSKVEIARRFSVSDMTVRDVLGERRAYSSNRVTRRAVVERATPGSGQARLWTADECAVAERMGRLVRAGLEVAAAAELARRPGDEIEVQPGVFVRVTVAVGVTA